MQALIEEVRKNPEVFNPLLPSVKRILNVQAYVERLPNELLNIVFKDLADDLALDLENYKKHGEDYIKSLPKYEQTEHVTEEGFEPTPFEEKKNETKDI
jgi:hypothetical protein